MYINIEFKRAEYSKAGRTTPHIMRCVYKVCKLSNTTQVLYQLIGISLICPFVIEIVVSGIVAQSSLGIIYYSLHKMY